MDSGNVFLEMVDETLRENGIDTADMTPEEKIQKFNELTEKAPDVAEDVSSKVAEEAEKSVDPAQNEEQPVEPGSPTKLS